VVNLEATWHVIEPALIPNFTFLGEDQQHRFTCNNDVVEVGVLVQVYDHVHGLFANVGDPVCHQLVGFCVLHLGLFLGIDFVVSGCPQRCELVTLYLKV
jgi:hypothetical protein